MLIVHLTADSGLEVIRGGEGEGSPEQGSLVWAQKHMGLPKQTAVVSSPSNPPPAERRGHGGARKAYGAIKHHLLSVSHRFRAN